MICETEFIKDWRKVLNELLEEEVPVLIRINNGNYWEALAQEALRGIKESYNFSFIGKAQVRLCRSLRLNLSQ